MTCAVSFSRVWFFVVFYFEDSQSVFLHIKIFSRCNFLGALIVAK